MPHCLAWLILAALPPTDVNVPPDAVGEIARRGALVERIDGISADDPQIAFAEAVRTPPDDSHKWFLSLVVTRGCLWCEQMRADFANDQRLRAWVNVQDPQKSWAHWQVFQIEDRSQEWRWKEYRPQRFPTLILQPPLNGAWGDPKTIVFVCEGYLPPDQLDARLREAIRRYAQRVWPQHVSWRQRQAKEQALAGPIGAADDDPSVGQLVGRDPPVPPPSPLPEPQVPFVLPPPPQPTPAPQPTPDGSSPLAMLGRALVALMPGVQTWLLLLLTASNVWMLYRDLARQSGVKLLIDDATAQQIQRVIRALSGQSGGPSEGSPRPPGA